MAVKSHSKLAYWPDLDLENTEPTIIPVSTPTKTSSFFSNWGIYLTDDGDAFSISLSSQNFASHISTNIKLISCNASMACLITFSSQLFVIGRDPLKYGLLGLPGIYETSMHPLLPSFKCASVSVGPTHVGLVDRIGNMFTWGSGNQCELGSEESCRNQPPSVVESARIFNVKKIFCGLGFTIISTAGGFVYIYGRLPLCHSSSQKFQNPYSIKGLEKLFTQQIVACEDFAAILTDTKDVYVVHSCLKLVKLPCKYKSIAGCSTAVYGITNDDLSLHEWKIGSGSMCRLQTLEASSYVFEETAEDGIRVFSGEFLSIAYECKSVKMTIKRRSNISLFSEISVEGKNIGRRSEIGRVSRYDIKKMSLLKNVVKVFSLHARQNIANCFNEFKDLVRLKKFSVRNSNILQIINAVSKILQRNKIIKESQTFKQIIFYREALEHKCQQQKEDSISLSFDVISKLIVNKKRMSLEYMKELFKRSKRIEAKGTNIEKILKRIILESYQEFFQRLKKYFDELNRVDIGIQMLEDLEIRLQWAYGFYGITSIFYANITKNRVIDNLLAFTGQKNKRVLILKFFDMWKRHRVSSKIAELSKKYASKTNARGLGMKLTKILRKSYKFGFFCIKDFNKPQASKKYSLMFLSSALKKIITHKKFSTFKLIHSESHRKTQFSRILSKLIKSKISAYYNLFSHYIEERKQYILMRVCLKISSAYEKFEYKILVRSFSRFKTFHLKNSSQIIERLNNSSTKATGYKIAINGDLSYKKQLKLNLLDTGSKSPVSAVKTPSAKTPSILIRSNANTKTNAKGFKNQKKLTIQTNKKPTNKLQTEDKEIFESLVDKINEAESPTLLQPSTAMISTNYSPPIEPKSAIQLAQKYNDFEEDHSVKCKLAISSILKIVMLMITDTYLSTFSSIKSYKKTVAKKINLSFLDSSSASISNSEEIEELAIEKNDFEISEEPEDIEESVSIRIQPNPWVKQLQTLGATLLKKISESRLKSYYNSLI